MKLRSLFVLLALLVFVFPVTAQDIDLEAHLDNYLQNELPEGWGVVRVDALFTETLENPPFLLDVRQPEELGEVGHIPGAVHVPLRELADNLDLLPVDLDAPIVVYCKSGHRGAIAMTALQILGYTNVRNLAGGIDGWIGQSYEVSTDPIEAEAGEAADVDPALVAVVSDYLQNGLPQGWGVVRADALFTELLESEPFLLDVRQPEELEQDGFIAGAVNVPLREVAASLAMLPEDRDTPIVVYCKAGHRGTIAMTIVQMLGYTDVRNLAGGFSGWLSAGYPVEGAPEPAEVTTADITLPEGDMLAVETLQPVVLDFLAELPQGFASAPANQLAAEVDNYFVLDVRQLDEYESGHIEGAVNIPIRDLAKNLHLLPPLDTPILVYCSAGHRGAIGLMALDLLGYENIISLRGGLRAWSDGGFPLVAESTPETEPGPFPEVDADVWTTVDAYLSSLPEGFSVISADNLNLAQIEGEEFFLIDVREPAEYEAGHIPGAVNMPTRQFGEFMSELPATDAPIIVYGSVGHRGTLVMTALQMLGYTDVRNVGFGTDAWTAAGYELVTE